MNPLKTQIKICGVKDPNIAYRIALCGVQYIGVLFHEKSKRLVDLELAKSIANAAKAGGAVPVAVFGDQTAEQIQDICNTTGITVAQLHGNVSRSQHKYLSHDIVKFFVVHVSDKGNIVHTDVNDLTLLDIKRDVVLFDNFNRNSGRITITEKMIDIAKKYRTFVAGGINQDNVRSIINKCDPYGIDISSSVENSRGEKSIKLINELLTSINRGDNSYDQ